MAEESGGFKIEKNVPVPAREQRRRASVYLAVLQKMDIGDSFVCTRTSKAFAAPRTAAKRLGMKITMRSVNETEVRIWRVR